MDADAKKPKKRKKTLRVFLIVLAALFLLLIVFAAKIFVEYKASIDALSYASGLSSEEISSRREENDNLFRDILQSLIESGAILNPLSEEDRQKLKDGEISKDDALQIILNEQSNKDDAQSDKEQGGTTAAPEQTTASGEDAKFDENALPVYTRIEELIADIYLLRAEFLNRIDLLIDEGRQEYTAEPEEKRTLTYKMNFAKKYLALGDKLEQECDSRMARLIAALTKMLEEGGKDKSLIDKINGAYSEEKKIYKAELIEKYYPTEK